MLLRRCAFVISIIAAGSNIANAIDDFPVIDGDSLSKTSESRSNGVDEMAPTDQGYLEPKTENPDVPQPKLKKVPYTKPMVNGLIMAETFDEELDRNWVHAKSNKFTGEFVRSLRAEETIVGDYALKIPAKSQFFGISRRFPETDNRDGSDFVVSYETKFEQGLICGGAYLKIFNAGDMNLKDFNDTTSYAIMFGPDRCGTTDKIHLIIRARDQMTNEIVEHHLDEAPSTPNDSLTHAYTLRIDSNDRYAIYQDGEVIKQGSLHADFQPPFTPPKQISDPKDEKPYDWVDIERIPDPDAEKPEDWDEEAPMMIPDDKPMPEGWLEDEPLMIPDPQATKPEDLDDDDSWEPPMVSNPACAVGCGEWKPEKSNPDYKGQWSAPLINNPDYKGPWTPRMIPNPNYYEHKNPHRLLTAVDALGFDIWTTDKDLLFDNIVIAKDVNRVLQFLKETFEVRKQLETANTEARRMVAEGMTSRKGVEYYSAQLRMLKDMAINRPQVFFPAALLVVLLAMYVFKKAFCRRCVTAPQAKAAPVRRTSSVSDTSECREAEATATSTPTTRTRRRAAKPVSAD